MQSMRTPFSKVQAEAAGPLRITPCFHVHYAMHSKLLGCCVVSLPEAQVADDGCDCSSH